jgi:flagellar biosynthesis/type III secretory pathway chaperone
MSDEINFQLFLASGRFRHPVTDEQRASLSPEIRARMEAVEAAANALADVLAQEKQAVAERKVAAMVLDKAKAHLLTVQPPITALQEQRRMMLPAAERMRLARIPVAPEVKTAVFAAAEAEDKFNGLMTLCRNLQEQVLHCKAVVSRRIVEFQNEFTPQTPGELIKSHLKAEQARRAAGTEASKTDEPVILAPIDAYMRNSRGPMGVRSSRQQSRNPDGPRAGNVYPASWQGRRVAPPPPVDHRTYVVKPRGA